jgi:uncharacterized membrane protein
MSVLVTFVRLSLNSVQEFFYLERRDISVCACVRVHVCVCVLNVKNISLKSLYYIAEYTIQNLVMMISVYPHKQKRIYNHQHFKSYSFFS